MDNLLKDCKVIHVANAAVAGTSAVNSSIIDASGYDGVLFIADLGTVTAGSVLGLQAQDNTANSTSGMTNVGTAAAYTDVAGESSNTMLVVDVVLAQKRYLRAVLTRTTSNAVVDCIIAILYRTKTKPVTLDASVIASAISVAAN